MDRSRLRTPFLLTKISSTTMLLLTIFLSFSATTTLASPPPWNGPAFTGSVTDIAREAAAIKVDTAADVVVLLDERRYEFDASNRVKMTRHLIFRVDSPQGVTDWGTVDGYWRPWYQQRPSVRARVIASNGVVHQLDPKVLSDAAARRDETAVFEDARVYGGPLPAVGVGAVVEEEVVTEDTRPLSTAGLVLRAYIGRYVPVLATRVILNAPNALAFKYSLRVLPKATVHELPAGDRHIWTVEQGYLNALPEEEQYLPADVPPRPQVEFSSAASWQQVAQAYAMATEPKLRVEDVKPLLGSATLNETPFQIAVRIVAYLHREVRYTGVEFGEAQNIPAFPRETLKRKFGDCKDKAAVLVAMLRGSGVPAYLALLATGPGQDLASDLPGYGNFDHAIVYVPGAPDLWIDATAEYTRVGELPDADQGRLALVIRDSSISLVRTPEATSSTNLVIEERSFHLAEFGPARVVETTEPHGRAESSYRETYAGPTMDSTRKSVSSYLKSEYSAEALDRLEVSGIGDFKVPFRLHLEAKHASRGMTYMNSAAVGITLAGIASLLPAFFTEDSEEKKAKVDAGRRVRTADYVFSPLATEWRYHIVPPVGFRARTLPAGGVKYLGPARLTQEYRLEPDGSVNAVIRFDSIKNRYTPTEVANTRAALKSLGDERNVIVNFELVAAALLASGDFRGAMRAYQQLTALHPAEALHHVQIASGLFDVGLDERARKEALLATKLEPSSALAWEEQGWLLQHDLVGRRLGHGFDMAGAIAAYRKAKALDPKNLNLGIHLAFLLEHDARGVRYGAKAPLNDAIAEYSARKKLLGDDQEDSNETSFAVALMYAGRFRELRDWATTVGPSVERDAFALTATAVLSGASAAISESDQLGGNEATRAQRLGLGAGKLLLVRQYVLAVELLLAIPQSQRSADVSRLIDVLLKTKRREDVMLAHTDPRSVVQRLFDGVLASDPDQRALKSLFSRRLFDAGENARLIAGLAQVWTRLRASMRLASDDVFADLLVSNLRTNAEGDDGFGYRVHLDVFGQSPMDAFVIKEGGEYRLVGTTPEVSLLGKLALDRLATNDQAGARRWLDWARETTRRDGGDDVLAGELFPKFWNKGQAADDVVLRSAAASLLVHSSSMAQSAIEPLTVLRKRTAESAEDQRRIALALAYTYLTLKQWEPMRGAALELTRLAPESLTAFSLLVHANRELKRWGEVQSLANARLERLPGDAVALAVLAVAAESRQEFSKIRGLLRPIITSGRATANDNNRFAWYGMITPPIDQEILDAAREAVRQSNGNTLAIVHTLACVYAAAGKPKEARDLLLQAMTTFGLDEPDDAMWFAFGLVAEAYGDTETALSDFGRVTKSAGVPHDASSVFSLAQARMKTLRANSEGL